MFAPSPSKKPLTRREREVLDLISEGCSNKQGALRMNISPRTFESHRAEAMRKLGARNTADLVRKALLQPPDLCQLDQPAGSNCSVVAVGQSARQSVRRSARSST